jgi:hypothetical protein
MARQQTARRVTEVKTAPQPAGETAMLCFGPELAIAAIRFHLADEGISEQVVEDSARASVLRLSRSHNHPTISKPVWARMTNPQRLEWLLEQTGTIARLISDDASALEPMHR